MGKFYFYGDANDPLKLSAAKFYLNFETVKKMRQMPENLSEEEALILLSDVHLTAAFLKMVLNMKKINTKEQASEFEQEFAVRLEEKAKLKAVNCKNIRFKIKTNPGGWTTSRKISAILQAQVNISHSRMYVNECVVCVNVRVCVSLCLSLIHI